MSKKQVYRKISLERLSSPEQLDQLMQVTQPQGWLALVVLLTLILLAFVWSLFGSIPTEARGRGILLRQGGVSQIVAAGTGQVEEVLVQVGDALEKGTVVARVRQESLLREIEDGQARKAELEAEYGDLERYAEEQKRLSAANLAQQRANLERSIATLERQVELLEERHRIQSELLADGLITQQALLTLEQEANTTRDQLAAERLELGGLELRRLEAEQELEQQLERRRAVLRDLELVLRARQVSLEENVRIVSPGAGRVLELLVDRGDVVSPGTPVLTMEIVSEELVAVIFVPAALGKQVQDGMEAQVVPSTVQREQYGFLLGKVVRVAEFPSTSRGMRRLLANEELVTSLMEEGPPIQVDVALESDGSTPSGYRWSSSGGPDLEITSGTLASGSIIVRRDRPILLVVPGIREQLGI